MNPLDNPGHHAPIETMFFVLAERQAVPDNWFPRPALPNSPNVIGQSG